MATDLDLRGLPPYSAILWEQFEQNPRIMYNLFRRVGHPARYESDNVIDLTGTSARLRHFKVTNVDELHMLTRDLLRMPILFRVNVRHQKRQEYVVMSVTRTWAAEFAVLVNPQSPQIREILSRRLSEAMNYMINGNKFCITIGFGKNIKQWFAGVVDSEGYSSCDVTCGSDNNIYIHNYSTPVSCCMNPVCIFACFPFWFTFGGPCYLIHRKMKYNDVEEHIKDLPVTMVTGLQTIVVEHRVPSHPMTSPTPQQTHLPVSNYNTRYSGHPMTPSEPPPLYEDLPNPPRYTT